MKTLKVLSGIFFALFLVYFTLNYFNNNARKSNKQKLEIQTLKNSDLLADLKIYQDSIQGLKDSKQKVDTFIKDISGQQIKEYEKRIKDAARVVYLDTTDKDVKILIDSLKSDELTLNYTAEYIGKIYNIDFTWTVHQKEIVKENISYIPKPYPVDKLVPINKREFYLGASLMSFKNPSVGFGIMYCDKKKKAYAFKYDPFNKDFAFDVYLKLF